MPLTPLVETISTVRAAVAAAKSAGRAVALVPTMGALHAGHAELVRVARREVGGSGFVVVSVFVNPTQFGPAEDFARYPRTLAADRELTADAGADCLFHPAAAEMYPGVPAAFVEVAGLGEFLCGPSRPGHFRGVCTVVLKLFNIVAPDVAVFGAKDAQQARVLKKMVIDLDVPVRMVVAPTVREADGLAMSSRNAYLSPAERAAAPAIFAALQATQARAAAGERDARRLEAALAADLAAIPGGTVEYAQVVDDETLQPLTTLDRTALCAVAIRLGRTRLIDNVTVS